MSACVPPVPAERPQSAMKGINLTGGMLEEAYLRYNRKDYIHPDPVEFVWWYTYPGDREIAALLASALALGRASCILRALGDALARLGEPLKAVTTFGRKHLRDLFRDFRYRFYDGGQLAGFLSCAGDCVRRYGSLEACFLRGKDEGDTFDVLASFLKESGLGEFDILPDPAKGSACKRLHLFLRWMVRRDEIDPGGWDYPASRLIVPVDTHMMRAGRALGFTGRNQPDARSAREITEGFRRFASDDPVRYDFSITRMGIREDLDLDKWLDLHINPERV